MVQLRFALFAIIVLGLWIGHLYVLSPSVSARAVDAAIAHTTAAPAAVEAKIDERRREFQRVAARVVGSSGLAALAAARTKGEAPNAEKFAAVRDAVASAAPEPLREKLVIGLSNEFGTIYSRGSGKPVTGKSELDLGALVQAGTEGVWQEAFGTSHLFFSFPVAGTDRADNKPLGFAVAGFPLGAESFLESAAKDAGLGAIALLRGGKVVSIAGPEKIKPDQIDRNITPGRSAVAGWGSLSSLGPLKFPIFTNGDVVGGRAPLWVASRQAVASTPYEVMGLVTLRPFMQALGDYQRLALLGFVIILGLSLVSVLLGGAHGALFERDDEEPRAVLSAAFRRHGALSGQKPRPEYEPLPLADAPLTAASDPTPPWFAPSASGDESALPPPPPVEAFSETSPFGGGAMPVSSSSEETRVATIPEELLRASAFATEEPPPARSTVPAKAPAVPSKAHDADEEHFREVFKEFVSTRARCGESADGLSYERFATKLRKNRDQLIQKYNCRTVRFQVYVKEGKAALKATPVRH